MIVVFGSVNLDLVARVERLPRAGETLAGRAFVTSPGGKGANQALAARRAGADVALYGAVGRDAFAAPALALLRDTGVDLRGIREVDEGTGVALIHVEDSGENSITVIAGANGHARAAQVPDDMLGAQTVVVLQFETPAGESLRLAQRARSRGARVVLNTAPAMAVDATWLDAVDVIVANEHEAAVVAGALGLPEEAESFAAALAQRHDVTAIVTLGVRGAVASERAVRYAVPALEVRCVDTVGAGDAFVGVLAAAVARGDTLARAIAHASAAGGLACTREGAQSSLPVASEIAVAAGTLESHVQVTTIAAR